MVSICVLIDMMIWTIFSIWFRSFLTPYPDSNTFGNTNGYKHRDAHANIYPNIYPYSTHTSTPLPPTATPTPVTTTSRFQMGLNGYSGVKDTTISLSDADRSF